MIESRKRIHERIGDSVDLRAADSAAIKGLYKIEKYNQTVNWLHKTKNSGNKTVLRNS